jgi:hypothetical protein
VNTEEIRNDFENVNIAHDSSIFVLVLVNSKLEIAKVKDSGQELAPLGDMTFREAYSYGLEGYFELIKSLPVIIPATVPPHRCRRCTLPQVVEKMEVLTFPR